MDRIGDKKMRYEEELNTENLFYNTNEYDFNLIKTQDIVPTSDIKDIISDGIDTYDDYNAKAKEYGILIYNPVDNTILFGDQTSKNINNVVRTFDISAAKDAIKDEFIKRNAKYVITKENKQDGSISFELSGEPKQDDNTYKILDNTKTDTILSELEHICSYGIDIDHRISTLDDRKNIQNKLNDSLNELKIFRDYNQDFER